MHEIREYLSCNFETGILVWIKPRKGTRLGGIAGSLDKTNGYIRIKYKGKVYQAHRLVWWFAHGKFPEKDIDNEDTVKTHNWLSNLREASDTQNHYNVGMSKRNKSGLKGVSWYSRDKNWQASININGKNTNLGCFNTKKEAAAAYQIAAKELHGEFFHSP